MRVSAKGWLRDGGSSSGLGRQSQQAGFWSETDPGARDSERRASENPGTRQPWSGLRGLVQRTGKEDASL